MGNSSGKPVVFTDEVNLNHFRLLRVVGKGAFGKVRIVERKDTGLTFALKYIRKDEIVRSESVRNIIRERKMLEHLDHPFLCNLRYSFQDIEYLYIVVDLMTGGDLRFHISRKTFTEEAVQFWIAELACALRYIHRRGIVHRDLKPDNVLLDVDGHVHLADFNVASELTPNKLLTSKSGTLAYLAPEVYEGRGYASEVDWWSLGVTFYECIYNKRPFEASNHESLSQKIMKGEPKYPTTNPPVSQPCLHAISSLLEKDRTKRIGATGFETFTDNPFFRPIDFNALERKHYEPVFKPSSDKTNFDATYDLEELLLEEAPLEARARRQKPREKLKDDATEEEVRAEKLHEMIETMFQPFNYTKEEEKPTLSLGTSTPFSMHSQGDYTTVGSHTNSQASPVSQHHPPSFSKPLPRDRDRDIPPDYSERATPVRTRSSTQSPNGSPPFHASVAGFQAAAEHSPTSDPSALPIQTYDSRIDLFSTNSDLEARWDQERERERIRAEQDRHRGTSASPPIPVDFEVPPGMPGYFGNFPVPPGGAGPNPRQWDVVGPPDLYMYGHGESRGQPDTRRNQNFSSQRAANPQYASQRGKSAGRATSGHIVPNDSTQDCYNDFERAGGAVHPVRTNTHGSAHSHNTSVATAATTALPSVNNTATADFAPDPEERPTSRPTGMLGFLSRKKGRDRSPRGSTHGSDGKEGDVREKRKGKERERGVLGKEGARVIVANG